LAFISRTPTRRASSRASAIRTSPFAFKSLIRAHSTSRRRSRHVTRSELVILGSRACWFRFPLSGEEETSFKRSPISEKTQSGHLRLVFRLSPRCECSVRLRPASARMKFSVTIPRISSAVVAPAQRGEFERTRCLAPDPIEGDPERSAGHTAVRRRYGSTSGPSEGSAAPMRADWRSCRSAAALH
jgi:hypothetical protein